MKPIKSCTGIDCPERFSKCCGAPSTAISGDEGTGYFICKKCFKEFVGGACTAGETAEKFKGESFRVGYQTGVDETRVKILNLVEGFTDTFPEIASDDYVRGYKACKDKMIDIIK